MLGHVQTQSLKYAECLQPVISKTSNSPKFQNFERKVPPFGL
jgi:hypothetical protein